MRVPDPWSLFGPGYKAGARIHSASWGTNDNSYTAYDSLIDMYAYDHPDFLFVVAAGNEGEGNAHHTVGSPATTKNSIAVGASQSRASNYLAPFSSRGPTADGRMKPDVVAPGHSILSARADPGFTGECDDTESSGLFQMSGTSMATPMVSGAAALIRQYFADGWYYDGAINPSFGYSPRASLVKAVILNGAEALLGVDSETSSKAYDQHQGFGRVNLSSSLPLKGENDLGGIFVNSQSISNGEKNTYKVTVSSSEACDAPLSATLVWTDPPVAPNCNRGCVLNDLDLYVTRNGNIGKIFPNDLNQADSTNNAERVRIENPVTDATYTIHVEGTELLVNQDYSLVITGCILPDEDNSEDGTSKATDPTQDLLEQKECDDGNGQIAVSDTEMQDCVWLSEHTDSHGFLCEFFDVASECPSTCNKCPISGNKNGDETPRQSAVVPLDGGVRWYGNRFDVQAKKDIQLLGFDLHFQSMKSRRVQVSVRRGARDSPEDDSWTQLFDADVMASGKTGIEGPTFEAFEMEKGMFYTFYLTVVGNPDMVMTSHDGENGAVVLDTDDILIRSGVAVTYQDQATYDGYSFNGSMRYILPDAPTCSDSAGSIEIVEAGGAKSCDWLSKNMDRFRYVCSFAELATFCPKTCGFCDAL
jgi:hypothetical protein